MLFIKQILVFIRQKKPQKKYVFLWFLVSADNRQKSGGSMRKQKVGQEVFLAARCHKYLLQSQQYSAATMTQVTADALHSVLITIQYTHTVGLPRCMHTCSCSRGIASSRSYLHTVALRCISYFILCYSHSSAHTFLYLHRHSFVFSYIDSSPGVQGSFQNSSCQYAQVIHDTESGFKSPLFIGLNWIFLSFVQTAVITSIKGKKTKQFLLLLWRCAIMSGLPLQKNSNKETILLGRVLETAVGVTWVHSTTTCSFSIWYNCTKFMFEAANMCLSKWKKNQVYCWCVCINISNNIGYVFIKLCYTECTIINMCVNERERICGEWVDCLCEERMRLPACMLSSLTTILTCLSSEWVWMHAYLSTTVCVREYETESERVFFMACVCVSLPDRCVSRPQVGGRGSNSCPSPRRWQPAEQHQSLPDPNLSVSLSQSVWLCLLLLPLLLSPSALADRAWQTLF